MEATKYTPTNTIGGPPQKTVPGPLPNYYILPSHASTLVQYYVLKEDMAEDGCLYFDAEFAEKFVRETLILSYPLKMTISISLYGEPCPDITDQVPHRCELQFFDTADGTDPRFHLRAAVLKFRDVNSEVKKGSTLKLEYRCWEISGGGLQGKDPIYHFCMCHYAASPEKKDLKYPHLEEKNEHLEERNEQKTECSDTETPDWTSDSDLSKPSSSEGSSPVKAASKREGTRFCDLEIVEEDPPAATWLGGAADHRPLHAADHRPWHAADHRPWHATAAGRTSKKTRRGSRKRHRNRGLKRQRALAAHAYAVTASAPHTTGRSSQMSKEAL